MSIYSQLLGTTVRANVQHNVASAHRTIRDYNGRVRHSDLVHLLQDNRYQESRDAGRDAYPANEPPAKRRSVLGVLLVDE